MISLGGMSLRALNVAFRYARMCKVVPNEASKWTEEDNRKIKDLCTEIDRRHNEN